MKTKKVALSVTEEELKDAIFVLDEELQKQGDDLPNRPAYRFLQKLETEAEK